MARPSDCRNRVFLILVLVALVYANSLGVADAKNFRLAILGDSLTEANGSLIAPEDSFPNRLEVSLRKRGYDVQIISLSRGGFWAYQGGALLQRWLASGRLPLDAAIVALGTNDALGQNPPALTRGDLEAILQTFQNLDTEILLAGAYGDYAVWGQGYSTAAEINAFEVIYPRLAAEYDTLLYPYFLAGVRDDHTTYTSDGVHPNAAGVRLIVKRILPEVETLLKKAGAVPNPRSRFSTDRQAGLK